MVEGTDRERERGGGQFRRVDLPESFLVDVVPALWILYFLVLFFSILTNLSLLYICTYKLNKKKNYVNSINFYLMIIFKNLEFGLHFSFNIFHTCKIQNIRDSR